LYTSHAVSFSIACLDLCFFNSFKILNSIGIVLLLDLVFGSNSNISVFFSETVLLTIWTLLNILETEIVLLSKSILLHLNAGTSPILRPVSKTKIINALYLRFLRDLINFVCASTVKASISFFDFTLGRVTLLHGFNNIYCSLTACNKQGGNTLIIFFNMLVSLFSFLN
jgi:hypothetical protein